MIRKFAMIAAATSFALPALADTQLRYVDERSGQQETAILIADGMMRMDDAESGTWTLFDAKSRTFFTIDPAERNYTRMDEKAIEQLSQQVGGAMAEMRKQLEQMPPEQRAMMERMMGGAAKAAGSMLEMKIERSGRTMERGGYDCEQVFHSVGSMGRSELCVVPMDRLDIPAGDLETLQAMQELMQKFGESMSNSVGVDFSFDFAALGGMPVYTKSDDEASGDTLAEVSHARVDRSLLRVPEGYREETIEPGN